jgi:hypothetical protein
MEIRSSSYAAATLNISKKIKHSKHVCDFYVEAYNLASLQPCTAVSSHTYQASDTCSHKEVGLYYVCASSCLMVEQQFSIMLIQVWQFSSNKGYTKCFKKVSSSGEEIKNKGLILKRSHPNST